MAMELVYTSAPEGLRPGSSGFCTVAMTSGMPLSLVPQLEALGGYRPGPGAAELVARCHWVIDGPSGTVHVLSRVGPGPADHTGRGNKVASYLVLGQDEMPEAGPAWLLAQPGLLRESWHGKPALIEAPVRVPKGVAGGSAVAEAWRQECGDAGWAGVVASSFLRERHLPVHVIVREDADALALAGEVLRLLPAWSRWGATFSTYFLQPVAGVPCAIRFCIQGTPAAETARGSAMRVIDLTGPVGDAPDSKYSRLARTGIIEERADTAVRVSSGSAPEPEGDPRCPAEPRSPVPAAAVVHETPPCPPADEKAGGNPVRLAAVVAVAVAVTVALLVALFAMTGGASGGGQ